MLEKIKSIMLQYYHKSIIREKAFCLNLLTSKIYTSIIYYAWLKFIMRSWWNWQTRTLEGRMREHVGSSPTVRTNNLD